MSAIAAKKAIVRLDVAGVAVPVGEVRSFSIETALGTIDVSTLSTTWKNFLVGQAGWSGTMDLFYDPTDDGQEELVARALEGTPMEFTFLPFGADEIYDLDLGGASGGTFTLGDGDTIITDALPYNATAAAIQTALRTAYDDTGILVVANGADFVISFPTGVEAELTLGSASLIGATDPAVELRDELAEYVGTGHITNWSPSGATEDAVGVSISVQGDGELELNPA
ncbi:MULTISPECIES: hypothetical protein [Aminobacterium]|jgi:hypothetical protein|uniref:hypothetical protein n=1 Tax=Aminobacterium TaxID=81466 RepID=UPI00257CFD1F|nr:hypothetical protein [Aminobacterium sp. UBA4987]